jgi:hypothetical protein
MRRFTADLNVNTVLYVDQILSRSGYNFCLYLELVQTNYAKKVVLNIPYLV